MNELPNIEQGSPRHATVAHDVEHPYSILRISCPLYWLQTIERVVCFEEDWVYPQLQKEKNLEDVLPNISLLVRPLSSSVLNTIHCVTQADMNDDSEIWATFLKRFAGHTLREYWADSMQINKATDEFTGLFDAIVTKALLKGIIDRVLQRSSLGVTEDGHLILGSRKNRLEKHDRIGFIPNSLETFIFRPCGTGYRFITNCWQSDTPKLIEVESLQLGDKETITII